MYRNAPDAIWETSLVEWGMRAAFQHSASEWWQGYLDRGYESFKGKAANLAHKGLERLTAACPSVKLITQNVDGLHSGCPQDQLVEVHGRLGLLKCITDGLVDARAGARAPVLVRVRVLVMVPVNVTLRCIPHPK